MTIVSSAMPSSSSLASMRPMFSSWATMTSLYSPCPLLPLCFSAQCVLKCIAVVLYQRKNGFPSLWIVDEGEGMLGYLVIDGFHALFGQRTGILDSLSALAVRPAVQHASGAEPLFELRVLRIIRVFRLFLCV